MAAPHISPLVDELAAALDATPPKKDANLARVMVALDTLLDEVRSGVRLGSAVVSDSIIPLWLRMLSYPQWHLRQYAMFGLVHMLADSSLDGSDDSPEQKLLSAVLSQLHNDNRQVRDAAAQALGAWAASRVEVLPALASRWADDMPWKSVEGFVVACGHVLRNQRSLVDPAAVAAGKQVLQLLMTLTTFDSVPSYSNFVRLQSVRALQRAVSAASQPSFSDLAAVLKAEVCVEEGEDAIVAVLFARFQDDNIDVRKAAAALAHAWVRLDAGETASWYVSFAKRLVDVTSWRAAHGMATALFLLCKDDSLLKAVDAAGLAVVADALQAAVATDFDVLDDTPSVAAAANATALHALLHLFLTAAACKRDGAGDGGADLDALYAALQQQLLGVLASVEPILLDAAGTCINLLLNRERAFVMPHLPPLAARVFKNTFHASLPIRDGALHAWRAAAGTGDAAAAFLAEMTLPITQTLLADRNSDNADVRETAFKALSALLKQDSLPEALWDAGDDMLSAMCEGCEDDRGGKGCGLDEAARAASTAALAQLLTAGGAAGRPLAAAAAGGDLPARLLSDVLPLVLRLLRDEMEGVVFAALQLVKALAHYWLLPGDEATAELRAAALPSLVGPLLAAAGSDMPSMRHAALPVLMAVVGVPAAALAADGSLLDAVAAQMALDDEEAEDSRREAMSAALREVALLPAVQVGNVLPALENWLLRGVQGLLLDETRDNPIVVANSLGVLFALLSNGTAAAALQSSICPPVRVRQLLCALAGYLLAHLRGEGDDFEAADDLWDDAGDSEDAAVGWASKADDEEDESDADGKAEEVEWKDAMWKGAQTIVMAELLVLALEHFPFAEKNRLMNTFVDVLQPFKASGPPAAQLWAHGWLCKLGEEDSAMLASVRGPRAELLGCLRDAGEVELAALCGKHGGDDDDLRRQQADGLLALVASSMEKAADDATACRLGVDALRLLRELRLASVTDWDALAALVTVAEPCPPDAEEWATGFAWLKAAGQPAALSGLTPSALQQAVLQTVDWLGREQGDDAVCAQLLSWLESVADMEASQLAVIQHIVELQRMTVISSASIAQVVAACLTALQSDDAADADGEAVVALCSLFCAAVKLAGVSDDAVDGLLAVLRAPWLREIEDGAAMMHVLAAAVRVCTAVGGGDARKASVLQLLADSLADEDLVDAAHKQLEEALLAAAEASTKAGRPLVLPAATEIDTARHNETFSKLADFTTEELRSDATAHM